MLQMLAAREGHLLDPAAAMGELNRRAATMSPGSATCTLGLGVLDTLSGSGRLCLAGHPRPLLCRQGEVARPLGRGGLPLGALDESVYENEEFRLGPGDRLVMFSDGFVDSRNPQGECFGVEGLKVALHSCGGDSPADLAHAASRALDTFRAGSVPEDDISMLVIATTGADRDVS
jgi:sigma-B regulation protein RsbU (phosphoserine phosphatase)